MVASRSRRRPLAVRLYVATALILAFPTRIASQDLASLLTYQPEPTERAQGFFLSFSALKMATFSFPRPAGIALPELPVVQVVARADRDPEITGSIPRRMSVAVPDAESDEPIGEPQFATINREHKGDMLVRRVTTVTARSEPAELPEVPPPAPEYDLSMSLEMDPGLPRPEDQPRPDRAGTLVDLKEEMPKQGVIARFSRLFFQRNNTLGSLPMIIDPGEMPKLASAPPGAPTEGATTIAAKGEVTGEEGRPKSPAERLGIKGAALAKAEKCLADAIYFESRGEPKQGQVAVAQVVVNRAFSGFYPSDVCGVVYQNANRYLACQFTFACEGKKLIVDEPDMWEQAKQISHDMLDGKLWLDEIGKATHYHAYWVRPDWIREMRRINRIGVHTFYRPRAWEG